MKIREHMYSSENIENKLGLSCAKLKLATNSSKLATQLYGLLTRQAVAGAGSSAEQRICSMKDEIALTSY